VDGDRDTQVDREIPERAKRAPSGETSRRSRRASSTAEAGGTESQADDVAAKNGSSNGEISTADLNALLAGLRDLRSGDFAVRLPRSRHPLMADIVSAFNDVASRNERMSKELGRVSDIVGRKGDMTARVSLDGMTGGWADNAAALNALVTDLVAPTTEVARVIKSVANGDLSQKMVLEIDGKSVQGEFLRIGATVNTMVDQLNAFASEVTRVAKEVGTEGKLGGQAQVPGVAGAWKDLTDNVNYMATNLTNQVRNIADVTTAVAKGDLSRKITVDVRGELLQLKNTVNVMVDQLNGFASEVTRVAREVGTEGKLGGQAQVPGVAGTWKDLTDSVNGMAGNLTVQLRDVSGVATAIASGDLTRKITVEAQGEILQIKDVINKMVDSLSIFAGEVTRVAREVGAEGRLGGQAQVPGVAGTWKDLTDNVNFMASSLTTQVRNIADVTTAVAKGDLSKKITVDVRGEVLDLKTTINVMVDQLSSFAAEVTRVAKEVGSEGRLGGQANVPGVGGTWKDLTDNVNVLAGNLTTQVRNIAQVTTAVARGDLSQKITVDVRGEILELKNTVNTMVDQLNAFADEVTRVAREVGSEGRLGGQAKVLGAAGVWRDLTDNVNGMASNLTNQVRNIADVTTAVAKGDLSRKITVDARGEILELKSTVNTMVDQLNAFADEVTRVAKEVGTEGKLGGQAEVPGVAGTWKDLTDSVNLLANNLTVQVRSIADVATAVTRGDLSQQITVQAQGELNELKNNINQMIGNLKNTTEANSEQDWLKTNLAKFSRMMQGQKDLDTVARLIMSELTPLVQARQGAFFIMQNDNGSGGALRLIASYAYKERKHLNSVWHLGEGLVGQAALEKKPILLTNVPPDYIQISSGLGEAPPRNIIVLPIVFEGDVKAVVELASFLPFSQIHQTFLDQLQESIGVVLNMIAANMRTEELLQQSQKLTQELQSQSEELRTQQEELRKSNSELEQQARTLKQSEEMLKDQQEELQQVNEELEEKASLLAEQNKKVEQKNSEVEAARVALEEKAEQLSVSSRYKSEFLANMSHELRTPLNSLLILARLMSENKDGNLTSKQIEYANTILSSGTDLLNLINDVLDLSKVEAGKMEVNPTEIAVTEVRDQVEKSFGPVADQKQLGLTVEVQPGTPSVVVTDGQRLNQILKNLLSNAFKFTHEGQVTLTIRSAERGRRFANAALDNAQSVLAFAVSDTGIGIAKDKQRLIFESFQQADGATSRKYGGTGLGLSISREIARLLGGEIRVESTPGVGSTFTLFLPDKFVDPSGSDAPADRDSALGTRDSATARRGLRGATQPRRPARAQPRQLAFPRPAKEGLAHVESNDEIGADASAGTATEDPPTHDDAWTDPDAEAAESRVPSAESREQPPDDRDTIQPSDRVLLIVENDLNFARVLLDMAREKGFMGIIALDGETGISLAHEYKPDAVTLDIDMPGIDGWQVLDRLKHHADTRHIPVHIISGVDRRQQGLMAGAIAYLEKPVDKAKLDEAFGHIRSFIDNRVKRLIIVEDDVNQQRSMVELIGDDDIEIVTVQSGEDALEELHRGHFDCMVLDLGLAGGMSGFDLLERVKSDQRQTIREIPIIIYTGRDLSQPEETRLRKYAETIILKDVKSPERLLDETALFLHRVEAKLPENKRRMLEQLHHTDAVFAGKHVLIVDDDVRNIFSLTSVLESHGMNVAFAENGRDAISMLQGNADVDLVLMDVMMPELDGYETTRLIRQDPRFRALPIIALTAKAMKGDREKCIAAGASDYITKPVDTEQLLSLMRVWLYR
jgi:HAMP domain-containing protein/CheY-like chemotaxis protein/signal transduction histidine kinase